MIRETLLLGIKKLKENNIDDADLKARMLMANVLNVSREYLVIHDNENIMPDKSNMFFESIDKLISGSPIQYVINKQEFMGLDFFVNENVLIPQPDTEILVEEVLNYIEKKSTVKILDLCTGSGAIAISIDKLNKSKALVYASDISKLALEVAYKNASMNKANIAFIESDLFENIKGKFDIIVSNPPYIKTNVIDTLSDEVKKEPHIALDGGKDGLDFYRNIINNSKDHLEKNGMLFLEIGYDQKEKVMNLLKNNNYKNIYSKQDYSGNDRIVVGGVE